MSDVDLLHIGGGDVVGGEKRLARAEREPGDCSDTNSESDTYAEARASDEGDQRGRVDGAADHAAGNPDPGAGHESPSAVMEGREAPGCVVNPGPAPRLDPGPVAIVIGCPADRDARNPDPAVAGFVAPDAIGVEILIADHGGRHVDGRGAAFFSRVLGGGELIEVVGRIGGADVGSCICCEVGGLAGVDREAVAVGGDFDFAGNDRDHGGVAGGVGIDAVVASAEEGDCALGRIHFIEVGVFEAAEADFHGAFGEADLHGLVVEIEETEVGLAVKAEGVGSDVHFSAGAGVGVDVVAGGERVIECRGGPGIDGSGLEGDVAVHPVEPCDAGGRVLRKCAGRGEDEGESKYVRFHRFQLPIRTRTGSGKGRF